MSLLQQSFDKSKLQGQRRLRNWEHRLPLWIRGEQSQIVEGGGKEVWFIGSNYCWKIRQIHWPSLPRFPGYYVVTDQAQSPWHPGPYQVPTWSSFWVQFLSIQREFFWLTIWARLHWDVSSPLPVMSAEFIPVFVVMWWVKWGPDGCR